MPEANNIFTNEQLNNFYLNNLNLANSLVPALSSNAAVNNLSSNFYEFLSVLFDVAADTAYYNRENQFGMKLPNNVITEEIDDDLTLVNNISSYITNYAQSVDFEFDESISIAQQIDDLTHAIYDFIQQKWLDGISSTYDEYYPIVDSLSSSMNALTSDFNTLTSETYSSYFCKSDNLYCYDANGEYLFEYF